MSDKTNYELALKNALKFFDNNELAATTYLNKYALKDKDGNYLETDPLQTIVRVMKVLADAMPEEKTIDAFYDNNGKATCKLSRPTEEWLKRVLKEEYDPLRSDRQYTWLEIFGKVCNNFKGIVPQGSVLAAAGDDTRLQSLSNCFVVPSPSDTMAGIMQTNEMMAQIFKRRGGSGCDLSTLRPDNATVNNAALKSSGAVGWANHFSNTCRDVAQSGRRGASMLTLNIKHPDSEKWAKMKNDLSYCTGANVSLWITDEFMNAVEKDEDFELQFPIDSANPIITKKIKARDLWNTICTSAWKMAEPGILNWDTITQTLPAHKYKGHEVVSTNPSLRGGTKVLTSNGIFNIEDLQDTEFKVKNLDGLWSKAKCFLSGKNKKLFKISLIGGHSYYATREHKWPIFHPGLKSFIKVNTEDLKPGLYLPVMKNEKLFDGKSGTWDEGFLIGCNLGDGWQTLRKDTKKLQIGFCCSTRSRGDSLVLKELQRIIKDMGIYNTFTQRESTYEINISNDLIRELFKKFNVVHKSEGLPTSIWKDTSEDFRLGLINGLISTDGYVRGRNSRGGRSLQLTTIHKALAQDFSALLGFYGIKSGIKYSSTTKSSFPNGKKYSRRYERYDIVISDALSLTHLKSLVTFINTSKNDAFYGLDCKLTQYHDKIMITKVEETNLKEDVWDISVDDTTHCFQLSHCITGNCSEISMGSFEACRLISIRLLEFIVNPFTKDAYFDFAKFEKYIRITVNMGEALVRAENNKIKQIIDKITKEQEADLEEKKVQYDLEINLWKQVLEKGERGRRLGLGDHGWGDMFAQLGIKYDSKEALELAEKIKKLYRDTAYDESIELAKVYGHFKIWSWEVEKGCKFFDTFPQDLLNKMKKYGRRHISLLTNAPTGSISLLGECSSGIEPTFRHMYTRRRKINENDLDSRVDFVDQNGDKWMEFPVFEKNIERYFKVIGKDISNFKTEEDLTKALPKYFITSDKIDWKKRIDFQAILTQYVDHSLSSTINLTSDTTVETVKDLYMYAWKKGLKGITVYREGCRSGVLISKKDEDPKQITRSKAPKRLNKLPCEVHFTKVKGTDYVVIVGLLKGSVYEIFCGEYSNQIPKKQFSGYVERKNKGEYYLCFLDDEKLEFREININEYFDNEQYEATTRLVSMSLRYGVELPYILDQLKKASKNITEFGSAISRVLKKYIGVEEMSSFYKSTYGDNIEVRMEDGCMKIINLDTGEVESKCD